MSTLFSIITNSQILKWAFGYSFTISSLAFAEAEFTNSDFFNSILHAIPSKVAMVLGILYGVVVLLGKVSSEWKKHQLNILEVKKSKELVEQEEIRTEKQRTENE